jgi:hypothetical protein
MTFALMHKMNELGEILYKGRVYQVNQMPIKYAANGLVFLRDDFDRKVLHVVTAADYVSADALLNVPKDINAN